MTNQEKEKYIVASFSSWQITETINSMFSEKYKPKSFQKYLNALGLGSKKEIKNIEEEIRKNIELAESIKALDTKRGEIIAD